MKTDAAIFMQHTEVPTDRTVAEITKLLTTIRARQISTEYDPETRRIVAVRWTMDAYGAERLFQMPARTEPVFQALRQRNKTRKSTADVRDQAERIAWRQLYRWLQATIPLISLKIADPEEVFLGYVRGPAETLHEFFKRCPRMLGEAK